MFSKLLSYLHHLKRKMNETFKLELFDNINSNLPLLLKMFLETSNLGPKLSKLSWVFWAAILKNYRHT